jgi:penicillin-insensitive murein endopeptidase
VALGLFAGLVLALGSACSRPGVLGDFRSVSLGQSNDGRILRPKRMPNFGKGHRTPDAWRARGNRYGTDELVGMIGRAGLSVRAKSRRSILAVADLSPKKGGATMWHRSHHSGRDVDLIFYSTDARRKPMPPPETHMVVYDAKGKPVPPEPGTEFEPDWEKRRFDTERNWWLVESLLSDTEARVQWIFVSDGLRARLLTWARKHKRPAWLIEYASRVMYQPGRKAPHDDHFHVRIYCTRADRAQGCVDTGPVWQHEKKTYKYAGREIYDPRWDRMPAPPVFLPVR